MTKTAINAPDLFVMLEREFLRRRPRDCPTCAPSYPFRIAQHHALAPNWQIVPAGECPLHCTALLEEVVTDLQRRFTLAEQGE